MSQDISDSRTHDLWVRLLSFNGPVRMVGGALVALGRVEDEIAQECLTAHVTNSSSQYGLGGTISALSANSQYTRSDLVKRITALRVLAGRA